MTCFTTRYYRIGQRPVAAVFNACGNNGIPMQAWFPNTQTGQMERMDSYIQDIAVSGETRPMTGDAFEAYCRKARIKTTLPEKSIRRSLALAALR